MWLSLIARYWKPVAALVLLAGTWCWGWQVGRGQVQTKWQAEVMAANYRAAQAEIRAREANDRATAAARESAEQRQTDYRTRRDRVEGYARDAKPVPAVCPGPDARITDELQDGAARIGAAEDRLRGLRRPEGGTAADPKPR